MATQVRCPKGHIWGPDEFDEAEPADPNAPVACPYCGALCTVVADSTPRSHWATSTRPETVDEPPRAEFPGYEILNVLGSGGMGVVYKARQLRTDRVVALKVPGHLNLETRVRFTTEAQAAARVSHPNIVQVYEVGEHQGRPFLALEYVAGGALADRLTGAPLPPRPAASLIETVARAVGVAHAHGVIHRDLKPGNILLSSKFQVPSSKPDDNLELGTWNLELDPKVADFGLARRIDTDTGQTRSGTILGTPDYMAPEQAAGDVHRVGPPADVYALGAILYQLLTGRPPFRGTGMLETLEQVRTLDPVPPRRLQPGVPRDLETICLKCLQKDPARRYPEAGELADDVRRFLDGQPVRARPVSRLERWAKRARRNPLASTLTAGLCVVLIAAAAYGVWYHFRLQAQRDRARYHFQMSVRSVEGLLTEVAEEDLALEPRAELKRKALLEKALAFYDELLKVEPDDPELAWLAARGARRVADILRLLGRYPEALTAYEQALDRLAPLTANPPDGTDPTREIADCHNFSGEVHRLRGDFTAADAAYRRALPIQEQLLNASTGHAGYLQDLSRTRYNLGIVAWQTGKTGVAVAELDEAARLLDGVPADDVGQRHHRARVYLNLGPARRLEGRLDAAAEACGRAIALYDELLEKNDRPDFRMERAAARINQGLVRYSARDLTGARASLTQAKDELERLVGAFQETTQYREKLASAYNGLAAVAFDANELPESAALSGQAIEQWRRLVAKHPGSAIFHGELGMTLGNQGRALYRSNSPKARKLLTEGMDEVLIALKMSPEDTAFRNSLRDQTKVLAGLFVYFGDHDAARDQARKVAAALPDRVASTHRAVALLAACVAAIERDKPAVAVDEIGKYEELAVDLIKGVGPADWSALVADADCKPLLDRSAFAKALGRQ